MPEEPMMTKAQRDELKTFCSQISQARCSRGRARSTLSMI
jgi:hypothetical protein